MKQSDVLELVDAGSLPRPGAVGRIVRLLLGIACMFAVVELAQHLQATTAQPWSTLDNRVLLLFAPFCIFNYVVNIGFGRSWGRMPLIATSAVLAASALLSVVVTGSADSPLFGIPLNLWLSYFYAHLGLSFLLAAAIGTPGCEMRAIPELLGRVSGHPSAEHHCPAGFITGLDAWERRRNSA